MELDGLAIGEGVLLGEEGGPEGGLAVVAELLIGKASEDGGLADARVAHCDQLDLVHFLALLLRHYRFIISPSSPSISSISILSHAPAITGL
jgi:hypothetical protein